MVKKNTLWALFLLVSIALLSSSCARRKHSCAAYNRTELPKAN
ncbi:MAG: hypothetical protein ACK5BL_00140 [Flavobacteriales bacterium]